MAFFLAQATYAIKGYRGMISDPHDRGPALEALADASGVKIIFMGYAVSTGQNKRYFEGTLKNVGGMEWLSPRSGAMADFKVTELISLADMADLMQAGGRSKRIPAQQRDEITKNAARRMTTIKGHLERRVQGYDQLLQEASAGPRARSGLG